MHFSRYIQARLKRGFHLRTLGPMEARLAYDMAAALTAFATALAFSVFFLGDGAWWPAAALPVLVLVFNWAIGVYSSRKRARGYIKAACLTASVLLSCAAGLLLGSSTAITVLWGLLVAGPLVLARILLDLPSSRNRELAAVAVNLRGPVLVIGGAGYIGTHVVDLLLKKGHSVRVLDKLMCGAEPIQEFQSHPAFDFLEGDATDIRKLTAAMRGVSGVVHLAGLVGDPACAVDPQFTRHTNIVATRMAKDVAQSLGVHRFIFASSCSVYGMSEVEVDEQGSLNPVSLYAQSKIDSEEELLASSPDDFFVTVLRFATVFGHSRRPRFDLVANLFTAQAMNEGLITVIGPHQWRPFIHVRDLARAVLLVLEADPITVQSQVFNVGDKRLNMTILQLAEAVKRVAGQYNDVRISVRENVEDRRNYAVSFAKIQSILGYQAETLIEHGIQEMVDEFRSGRYQHYRQDIYSNLEITKRLVTAEHDPLELMHIYTPLR